MDKAGVLPPSVNWPLGQLLEPLPPGVLQSLRLDVHTQRLQAALVQSLTRFAPSLRSLTLTAHLPAELPAALRALQRLTSLSLSPAALPDGTLPAVLALPALQQLTLISMAGPLPHCSQLTALRQLRRLRFVDGGQKGEPLLLPAPADFPLLKEFNFYSRSQERGARVRLRAAAAPFVTVLHRCGYGRLHVQRLVRSCPCAPAPHRHGAAGGRRSRALPQRLRPVQP